MTNYKGANDAFDAISFKVEEALNKAEACLRTAREDAIGEKSSISIPDDTVTPTVHSPIGSERSCSPNVSRASVSFSSTGRQNVDVKVTSYMSLNKKKAVVMTSFKSKSVISAEEVAKIEKIINDVLSQNLVSSSSYASI